MLKKSPDTNSETLLKKLQDLIADNNIRKITIYNRDCKEMLKCTLEINSTHKIFLALPESIIDKLSDPPVKVEERKETGTIIQQPVLIAIIDHSLKKIMKYRQNMQRDMAAEDVHQFRVEVKKLRAFPRMISADQRNKIKIPGRLRDEYRKAGAIRDLQLLTGHTTGAVVKTKYARELDGKRKSLISHAGKTGIIRWIKKADKKIRKGLPQYLPVAVAAKFIEGKLAFTRSITRKRAISNEEMHSVRKNLKDILYDVKNIGENVPAILWELHWSKEKQEFYARLAEDLGKYHDCTIELQKLEETSYTKDTENNREMIRRCDEQRTIRRQLNTSIRKQFSDNRIQDD
ncbi:CHAD domain-containing protein [Terrimonas sp. NA20]|uniref:CHAD domain-containing protein n=1 Tax=Terrimonas ginsenosidimutans TaxID=2908004 RepID=A0ABS9KVH0_9BACT|nr:CHAD domain-containing protein [Terrimonas ginsenosidimutans]MCG2616285.1 CHAD domain-containing protein [Terrimonas ginsenosidimutans]